MTDTLKKALETIEKQIKITNNELLSAAFDELVLAIKDNETQHEIDMIDSNDCSYNIGHGDGYAQGVEDGFDEACEGFEKNEKAS